MKMSFFDSNPPILTNIDSNNETNNQNSCDKTNLISSKGTTKLINFLLLHVFDFFFDPQMTFDLITNAYLCTTTLLNNLLKV